MTIQAVKWYEGLFLRPQHFQQQDRYFDNRISRLHQWSNVYPWGVVQINFNQDRLKQHAVSIEQLEIVFQDGTHCSTGENAVVSDRNFKEFWHSQRETLPVYVGIKRLFENSDNLSRDDDLRNDSNIFNARRFTAKSDKRYVRDMLDGGDKEEIQYLTYDLQIFFEDEKKNTDDFILIKIAEITKPKGDYEYSADYAPPSLFLSSAKTLLEKAKNFALEVDDYSRELTNARNFIFKQSTESGLSLKDYKTLSLLLNIRQFINELDVALEHPMTTPHSVYLQCRSFIASLSALTTEYNVFGKAREDTDPKAVAYDHDKLAPLFTYYFNLVRVIIKDILKEPGRLIPLRYDGAYFTGELVEKISTRKRYVLVVESDMPREVIENIIAPKIKVSSRETMPIMIARSLSGGKVKKVTAPIEGVVQKDNAAYLQIEFNDDVMKSINEANNIAVYFDKAQQKMHVEIIELHE